MTRSAHPRRRPAPVDAQRRLQRLDRPARIDEPALCDQVVAMTSEAVTERVSDAHPPVGPGWYLLRLGADCHVDGRLNALYRSVSLTRDVVYVGKSMDLDARIRRHAESLCQAGFNVERVLVSAVPVIHPATAALGELVLLNRPDAPSPLWQQLAGFGSRRMGHARERSQARASAWDSLHFPRVRAGVKVPSRTEHVLAFLRATAILAAPEGSVG